jgi:hypothetical protein
MGVSGQRHAPGKGPPVPIGQEAGWAPESVWTQRTEEKSFAPAGDRTPIVSRTKLFGINDGSICYWRIRLHRAHCWKRKTPVPILPFGWEGIREKERSNPFFSLRSERRRYQATRPPRAPCWPIRSWRPFSRSLCQSRAGASELVAVWLGSVTASRIVSAQLVNRNLKADDVSHLVVCFVRCLS